MASQARTGYAVGVTDSDGATVDVQVLSRDAQLVAAVDNLRSKGFVQLPQADVVHLQAVTLQQTRNGEDRADAHFVRLATGNREATEDTHRLNVQLLGNLAVHNSTDRRAVRQLAGVTGGDEVVRATHRLQGGQTFQGGARTVALVAIQHNFLIGDFAGFLVLNLHDGLERHDFVGELAALLTGSNALLAQQGVLVLRFTADVVALGYDVGSFDHGQVQLRLVLHDPLVGTVEHVDLVVLAQADGLNATGNDSRDLFADNALGSDSDGLQTRAAETVQGHAGGGNRQTTTDGSQTRHVLALSTFVESCAEDHVFNQCRVDTSAFNGFFDNEAGHVNTVRVVQCATVGFAQAGTGRGYDNCVCHVFCSCCNSSHQPAEVALSPAGPVVHPSVSACPVPLGRV